jgi:hypothetical protein
LSNANKLLNYRVDQETPKGEIEQRVETSEEQQTCSHCMGLHGDSLGPHGRGEAHEALTGQVHP